jgi:hypothetical protein
MGGSTAPRGNRLLIWCAVGLGLFGLSKVVHSGGAAGPPRPPAADGTPMVFPTTGAELGRAVPVHVDIPRVGIHADLIEVGLTGAGAIAVPPLNQALKAGWYQGSAAPGQLGSAVLDGHVDSREIPEPHQGAFYALGAVDPGDTVEVTRADHMVAVYAVDLVETASKAHFPTSKVYGPVPFAALRLVTCGGDFDYQAHSYVDNVIVYAHLTGTHAQ